MDYVMIFIDIDNISELCLAMPIYHYQVISKQHQLFQGASNSQHVL